MKTILFYWIPVILWCSLIFYLSSIPDLKTNLGIWDFILRKCAHMFEYAILFILNQRALKKTFSEWSVGKIILAAFCFSVLYAVSDEFHQSFVPSRGPSVRDVLIDTTGILGGFLFCKYWRKYKNETVSD